MGSEGQDRPRLTPKGERTRARIVEAAARLIYQRGVAGTTLWNMVYCKAHCKAQCEAQVKS